jgi:hypothetical protein
MVFMTELRANYYRVRGRSEMDIHHVGPDGMPFKVETLVVADKRDARRIAAERGAVVWNF